jgi:hypothetical protein
MSRRDGSWRSSGSAKRAGWSPTLSTATALDGAQFNGNARRPEGAPVALNRRRTSAVGAARGDAGGGRPPTRLRARPACCRVHGLVFVPVGSDPGSHRYRAPSPTRAVPGRAGNGPGITRPRTRYPDRGTREPNRSSDDDLPPCRGHQPARRRLRVRVRCLPWPAASVLGDPQAGSASEATGPAPGTFLALSAGLSGMLAWPPCPVFQRRSFWLDQASVKRALAVPSRGSSDAPATAPTSSRCSPGPPVSSRRPPCAAA